MTEPDPIRSRRARLPFAIVLAVFGIAGCDSSDTVDPRARTVSLSPVADDGSAWIELIGASVISVTAEDAQVFFAAHGDTTEVVIVRDEPGSLDFDLLVTDPTETPVGTALQVADGENRLRDATGYRVVVQP